MRVPQFGVNNKQTNLAFITQDLLNGMGNYFTQEIGSLNWLECYIYARALAANINFIQLMANQLSPNSSNVLLSDWSQIYNLVLTNDNQSSVQQNIEFRQSLFGTPPTLSAVTQYFEEQLGQIFIDLEWRPELQQFATTNPTVQISEDGYAYSAPLNAVMVYSWQPRDNQDNLLMPNNVFNSIVNSYHNTIEAWNPAYIEFITMNLIFCGNDDYCSYADGYNVISGTAGSTSITGVNTVFELYGNGQPGDFAQGVAEGFYPPLQVVDDTNTLQTYYVASVSNNTHLTLTTPLINNITSRTYRCLMFFLDTDGVLDDGSLFGY